MTEEASEATEEAGEASETEEGEDLEAVDATNLKAFVCHICIFNVFMMNDYEDLRDDVKCNVTFFRNTLVSWRHIFKVQLPKLLQQPN